MTLKIDYDIANELICPKAAIKDTYHAALSVGETWERGAGTMAWLIQTARGVGQGTKR